MGGTAYNFARMNANLPNPTEEYMTRCQNTMRQKYGEPVYILITQKADPANYPKGAWFDEYVNRPLLVAGVDEDTRLYILPGGNSVPFSCAELLSWTPPVFRSDDLVILVEEMYCTQRLPSQQEFLALLRLAFRDIPDNVELIISQYNPFVFADGMLLWLDEHRYQVGDYMVLFVAGVHKGQAAKVSVVALENGRGSCISLTKAAHA